MLLKDVLYNLTHKNKENVLPLLPHVLLVFAYNLKQQNRE